MILHLFIYCRTDLPYPARWVGFEQSGIYRGAHQAVGEVGRGGGGGGGGGVGHSSGKYPPKLINAQEPYADSAVSP